MRAFFENGGDQCHLYGVCIESQEDLHASIGVQSVLEPLMRRLLCEEDISLLAVPAAAYMECDMTRGGKVSHRADVLHRELLRHCQQMSNRFLIIDAPQNLHADALVAWLENFRETSHELLAYGAVYYPWLLNGEELHPPSGAVLGIFARTEREHDPFGVVWPPANVLVRGFTHPQVDLDWSEAGSLGAMSINPVVTQAGRGMVIFGARTLSHEPRWEFINSRRIVSMISEQLRRDNEWVVFEHNNKSIWKLLERDVKARLDQFWEKGMLTGRAAGLDYGVRCDDETNSKEDRDAGRLNVMVRIRPITTTEHITIDLRLGEGTV